MMIAKTHPDFPSDICWVLRASMCLLERVLNRNHLSSMLSSKAESYPGLLLSTLNAKLTLMNAQKKTEMLGLKMPVVGNFNHFEIC